jgi:SPP1 family predicted phage head-tail adaptor
VEVSVPVSLLDEYSKDCVLLVKTRVDDPLGGYMTVWVNGANFSAAWEYQSAPEIEVAEREGVERTYNIYVDKTLNLDFHEVFKRTDNGQIYRVTNPGTDRHTPSFSGLNRQLVTVEKWELPDGEESEDDVQGSGGA